jgi:O-methyltransferase
MSQPLSYFDLVVEVVRGKTPIPEFQGHVFDHTQIAEKHLKTLRTKYQNQHSGSFLFDMLLRISPRLLNKAWARLNPPALTMCGEKSVNQLKDALETIHKDNIPGDFIETGVWRGGLPIIMRAFLHAVGDKKRKVWVADSFKGLPMTSEDNKDKLAHEFLEPLNYLSASRKQVESAFDYFGLKDDQVGFLEGWFKDTLKTLPSSSLSLIRLDGDYYESTRDALNALYPKLSVGGYLIVDDFNLPLGCKRAVLEFREQNQIQEPMVKINRQAIYWRKSN